MMRGRRFIDGVQAAPLSGLSYISLAEFRLNRGIITLLGKIGNPSGMNLGLAPCRFLGGRTSLSHSAFRVRSNVIQRNRTLSVVAAHSDQELFPRATGIASCLGLVSFACLFPPACFASSDSIVAFDDQFRQGFISSFLLIFFSEIGDKTFFIAVLLALKEAKSLVFAGTFGALAVMTVISVALGRFLHELDELLPPLPFPLDDVLATILLVWFGLTTLAAAGEADETAEEEKEEAREVVEGFPKADSATLTLLASTFALVFAAEWGDKSFLATIALAAASSPGGVVAGAVAGHGVATGIAVVGGSFLGKYLSEKTVQYVGGSLFLIFAAATIVDIVRVSL